MTDDFDPSTVAWVMTPADLQQLCAAITICNEVVCDLETTGLDEHASTGGSTNGGVAARIVLASFTLPTDDDRPGKPTTWLLPLSHPDSPWISKWRSVLRQVAECIRDTNRSLVNQHVKFDAKWEHAQTGVDLSHQITWDTMVSSHLLDENASTSLKKRAPATFDVPPWDDFDLSTPGAAERVPLFDLGLYAARDTYWTWRLAEKHREDMFLTADEWERPETSDDMELAKLGRLSIWCAMPMVATLTAIEQRGMALDRPWVDRELTAHRSASADLTEALAHRYEGLDVESASFAPTSNWFRDWSAAAVKAGDLAIAELTPTGKPRWSKAVLVRQARAGSDVAIDLLALRSHLKKAEFLVSWMHHAAPDNTIHTTYWPGRVVTGRLSSEGPNMQQVTAELKPAFVPRPGYLFAEFDYGQIELRVAAFIARCIPMIEAFRRGDDLHRLLAARITGKAAALVLPSERQAGKSANFGLLYGMSPFGFQYYAETVYDVSFTEEEAVMIHAAFFDMWDGISAWHGRAIKEAQQTGQVISPIGRVRRLPEIYSPSPKIAGFAERSAINSPVQGFASDVMQLAAASIEGCLPGQPAVARARLVGTVHDSVLAEIPEDDWENVARQCQARMVNIGDALRRLDCNLDVPLVAEAKIGTRWGLSDIAVLA